METDGQVGINSYKETTKKFARAKKITSVEFHIIFQIIGRILTKESNDSKFYDHFNSGMRIRFWPRKRIRGSVPQTNEDFKKYIE